MLKALKNLKKDVKIIIWFALATFILASLMSYSPLDPSFNNEVIAGKVRNYCGYAGSFLAGMLLDLWGVGAWTFVIFLFREGYRILEKNAESSRWSWISSLLILINVSSLSALHFPNAFFYNKQVRAGGSLGALFSRGLQEIFNYTGVAIILWSLLFILISIYYEKSLVSVYDWAKEKFEEYDLRWQSVFVPLSKLQLAISASMAQSETRKNSAQEEKTKSILLKTESPLARPRGEEKNSKNENNKKSIFNMLPFKEENADRSSGLISLEMGREPSIESAHGRGAENSVANTLIERVAALDHRSQAEMSERQMASLERSGREVSRSDQPTSPSEPIPDKIKRVYANLVDAEEDDDQEDGLDADYNPHILTEGELFANDPSVNSGTGDGLERRKVRLKTKVQRRIENWKLPDLKLLEDPPASRYRVDEKEMKIKAIVLTDKLSQFSVSGEITSIKPGPAVTMFEFKPRSDVKISKITELADDLSLALSAESVRIIAPIPGRDVVGIETSNANRETVYLKDIVVDDNFWKEDMRLPIALGRQANGTPKVVDLRKMPHLLVAGTTGSGKSVFVVSILTGLLFRHSPKTLRIILVDPKQVDLTVFSKVPHLLMPVITDPKKAVVALKWAIREMEKRYRSMAKFGARGLEAFNEIVTKIEKEKLIEHEAVNQELSDAGKVIDMYYFQAQPYIVIVVEEFADLMAVDKANVEQSVVRLAQMARACGMHLTLAMQSPRKDVVTGLIKTNIPGRISFKVASKMDSRIILDDSGAERLLARGDMLFLAPGVAKPERHHGPWLAEDEISAVAKFWSDQGEPEFEASAMALIHKDPNASSEEADGGFGEAEEQDERYDEILSWCSTMKEVSASLIQRKFRLGYPRAARMIELFEKEGVVGPANGSKPRQVLVSSLKSL